LKILEENLQDCVNEVVYSENKEEAIYWLGRIHAFLLMAGEHDYELTIAVKLEKCEDKK
jgi:hypothetical protein